ncbi:glycosyltransferase family 4 protein [Zobellia uliginosa]|uniref:glycosyltransferase family 4 protein n=1 Tax=Zobellia uliginosa TaxID=143224 RepID=UPI0026E454ED|nr:glycosyltransferase family 4 protein [Zobellia uliginosa]MDO6518282.1 glycosyltransferase family 4 protein [Zobellia uliginosa]
MPKTKILIVASLDMSLLNFRGDLIKELIRNNYDVVCAAPDFQTSNIEELKRIGAQSVEFNLQRTGLNPLKDLKSINELKNIIIKYNIDLVFPYTIKPVIYGSMAAHRAGVPIISLITGLGFTFSAITLKARVLQTLTQLLYKHALKKNSVVIFQNQDDKKLFLDKKIVSQRKRTEVVDGSGINLEWFAFNRKKHTNNSVINFVIVGRLMKEKGVELFINSAKQLRAKYPNSKFHLIGSPPPNNGPGISIDGLKLLHDKGVVVFHGKTDNVAQLLSKMDVFVLPSYYREGVPRSILEGLSSGMPIITTNTPGCKETVLNGVNGFLIEPQQEKPLTKAMEYFLNNPEKIETMGLQSRQLAESKFDVNIINSKILQIIKDILKK